MLTPSCMWLICARSLTRACYVTGTKILLSWVWFLEDSAKFSFQYDREHSSCCYWFATFLSVFSSVDLQCREEGVWSVMANPGLYLYPALNLWSVRITIWSYERPRSRLIISFYSGSFSLLHCQLFISRSFAHHRSLYFAIVSSCF